MNVFLSYRRGDAAGHAGRLAEALERTFGDAAVFQDIEAIAPGEDFADAIDRALSASGVLLVMIGRGWLGAADAEDGRGCNFPKISCGWRSRRDSLMALP
ncbi:MAG: toll/interleukin-1 receptor domain-containing protein [Betaproteobacteria bacterium]|nr:toll/interleukin-1 receptor domain-containing protein [Betaproteobacteria bacterium]